MRARTTLNQFRHGEVVVDAEVAMKRLGRVPRLPEGLVATEL